MWPPLSAGTLLRVHPPDSFQPLCPGRKRLASSLFSRGERDVRSRGKDFYPARGILLFHSLLPFIPPSTLLSPPILSLSSCSCPPVFPLLSRDFFVPEAEIAEHGRNNFLSGFCGIDLEVCGKIRFALTHSFSLSLSLSFSFSRK